MTITNERRKLIDRVVKLLALGDSTNHSEEADTARKLAAELMAKHNIKASDAIKKGEDGFEKERAELRTKTIQRFDSDLVCTINSFCGVATIIHSNPYGKAAYTFVGRRCDIEAAEYMRDIITNQRKTAYDAYTKTYIEKWGRERWNKDESDWRRWHNGFTVGVASKLAELKKMSAAKVQEMGITVINPKDAATKWFNENVSRTVPQRGAMGAHSKDGYNAGKNVSIHKGVDTNSGTAKRLN